jgi:hypothetical protein
MRWIKIGNTVIDSEKVRFFSFDERLPRVITATYSEAPLYENFEVHQDDELEYVLEDVLLNLNEIEEIDGF